MEYKKLIEYELRHVVDYRKPYLTMLVDTYRDYMEAHAEAQRLLRASGGQYLIKRVAKQLVYVSKRWEAKT